MTKPKKETKGRVKNLKPKKVAGRQAEVRGGDTHVTDKTAGGRWPDAVFTAIGGTKP